MPEFRVAFLGSRGLLGGMCLLSSLSTTGCLFSTAKPAPRVFRPPPVQVQPAVVAEALIEESGPELELKSQENPAEIATLQMPEYPAPRRIPPPSRPAQPKAAPQPEAPLASPPTITQIFPPEQRTELNRQYREFLTMAEKALETLSRKRLSADQTSQMERIRVFKELAAEELKRDDLVTAVALMRRASSLAEDLVSRVR